jgi:DNA repair exonuclease SbcCD ATPase subunit
MTDMLIETQIDALAKIVAERKKITVSDAASLLKTSETQIEEWVRILEDSGLVELNYPALGEPIIVLKKLEASEAVKKEKELENKKEAIEEKTDVFKKKIEKVEKNILTRGKEFSQLEDELKGKLKELDKSLKAIDNLEARRQSIIKQSKEVKDIEDSVSKGIDDIKNDIKQMEDRINDNIKSIEGHEIDVKNLNQSKNDIEKEITELEREMKLVKLIVKRPIKIPLINLKNIFARHKEKTENISKKREELHKKALKIKSTISKKKEHVENKETSNQQFKYTYKY